MRIDDCNWMDVEKYLEKEKRIIIVVGACEQHAYLSLMTDTRIPMALADAASTKTGVLVAPPINTGVSPYFVDFPGTISMRATTMMDLIEDYLRSLYHQGFRHFLFLNGHGGNIPAKSRITEVANDLPELRARWYDWWIAPTVLEIARKHQLKPSHANWLEAFPFTIVTDDMPNDNKPTPDLTTITSAQVARENVGDGSYGGYYRVDPVIMDEMFATALLDILHNLEF